MVGVLMIGVGVACEGGGGEGVLCVLRVPGEDVRLEVLFEAGGVAAEGADEGLLARVRPHVAVAVRRAGEHLPAEAAGVLWGRRPWGLLLLGLQVVR